jgi:diguanylate cyclase (GGDEF)-like protein
VAKWQKRGCCTFTKDDGKTGMAIKKSIHTFGNSLHFRIVAPIIPIILLMILAGAAIFSLGVKTVQHYTNARIEEDLERYSRELYDICDSALQNLLLENTDDMDVAANIKKGYTVGKIEDYAKQNNLQIILYEGHEKKILLHRSLPPPQKILLDVEGAQSLSVIHMVHDKHDYYGRQIDFELWNWHIVIVKDGRTYAQFVSTIIQSYYVIGAILIIVSLILAFYFRRVVHKPIRQIIESIQANGMPEYKGIYEFEFLSNIIREATKKEQQKQEEMSYQATHDELTGLLNRRAFEHELDLLLKKQHSGYALHTIFYLDLDQFKIVNDTCGHHAGDVLLQQVTKVIKDRLRQNDILARLGGDEFGILLENCYGEPALRIAELIRQTVSEFRFSWNAKLFSVGVSVGLVSFASDEFAQADLLSIVDGACYLAKEKGRNRIHVYHQNDIELIERKGQMSWVTRITDALEEDRFVLYKQEIISLKFTNEKTLRFEILLRMLDDDGSLILPSSFLPAAERYNLILSIDFWVIKNAFEYLRDYCTHADVDYTCFINLSGATVGQERLIDYVHEQFKIYGVSPSAVCFEITETAAIANLNNASKTIQELRKIGCRFALDDFGSGMSSFGYLKNLPIDFLKIDGEFVKNMHMDRIDRTMVEAINKIGQVMGIQTIAEFVENDLIAEELRKINVDYVQGYGISRPVPIKEPAAVNQNNGVVLLNNVAFEGI